MESQTVTVGDTEVQITETEDGFEVEEADDEPESGIWLRAESNDGYGCEIPLSSDFLLKSDGLDDDLSYIAWYTDDDVSDLNSHGASGPITADEREEYDAVAAVLTEKIKVIAR